VIKMHDCDFMHRSSLQHFLFPDFAQPKILFPARLTIGISLATIWVVAA